MDEGVITVGGSFRHGLTVYHNSIPLVLTPLESEHLLIILNDMKAREAPFQPRRPAP